MIDAADKSKHAGFPSAGRWDGGVYVGIVLASALAASGFLMAAALAAPNHPWLAWVSLLPLFVAIKQLNPRRSAACGALWGLSLFVSLLLLTQGIVHPIRAGLLLILAPAAYAYGATALSRWAGFSPIVLGLGWAAMELLLQPLGFRHGLLASTQESIAPVLWLNQVFGYVFVAFLVASISASFLVVVGEVRFCATGRQPIVKSQLRRACLQQAAAIRLWFLSGSARPRAPPA